MKRFKASAMRLATDSARLSAANELVQRTLVQHGIVPRNELTAAAARGTIPSIHGLLGRLGDPLGKAAFVDALQPEGAAFRQGTFSCAHGSRMVRTYVPASASKGATGVVVMLHGCTQTPEDFSTGTGMNALAELHRFIVVYPAQSRGENAQSCWNWFKRGDQHRDRGEPAILAGMTQQVCTEFGIGRERTFVAGLSAGAAMAVILGETYPDVYSAVGAHSGLPAGAAKDVPSAFAAMAGNALDELPCPMGNAQVRTLVFHGTSDATVHPSNSNAIVRRALELGAPQSFETTTKGQAGGRSFAHSVFCHADGPSVAEHWAVDDLGHAWSGGKPAGSYTDPKGPDASAEMIRFFFNMPNKDQ